MIIMRRIAFLQKTNKYSGAENIVITIMKLLPKDEYECVYVSPDGEIRTVVVEEGLKFYAIPNTSLKSIKLAIQEIKPDIIHATDYGMSSYAGLLNMKIPVVSHLHNNVPWLRNPLHPKTLFFAFTLPNIDQVISVSPSIQEEFVYRKRIRAKNHVIYNVVNLDRVKDFSEETNPPCNDVYDIVYLGRLSPPKKPLFFCDVIKRYKKIDENVTAIMLGDGKLWDEVEKYIESSGLSKNIVMVGFQKNPYQFVKNAKLLLMPSGYEGFGLAAVECLSLGLPVVCSGVGGLRNIITSDCGAICNDISTYVDEIQKLLTNSAYYEYKSINARKRAQEFGNLKNYIDQIIKVYDECMKRRN